MSNESPDPLPRAYAIARTRIADDAAALQRLRGARLGPGAGAGAPRGPGLVTGRPLAGSTRIVEERTDRVVLEAGLSEPGFVVLVDTFDPGWRAAVDGEPRPVLSANVAFRAVAVPAGRHLVSFEYRPWPVAAGAAVSAGTAILLLGLLAVRRASRRALPSPSGAA